MEMVFNELSTIPLSENINSASIKILALVYSYKKARDKGFKKIRFSAHIHEIEIAENYTMQDWVQQTDQRTLKSLLLSCIVHPFIRQEDEWAEDEYINNTYSFENAENNIVRVACEGLAAADIYGTLSVSLQNGSPWENNLLQVIKEDSDNNQETKNVVNVFSDLCFEKAEVAEFVSLISELVLVETDALFDNKPLSLRDDHGKDILKIFAKKILKSPYVLEVVNSLPFNSKTVNFIRKTCENGLIEVVLHWEDKGYGMVLKTTGRNMRETQEIAKKLTEEFDE